MDKMQLTFGNAFNRSVLLYAQKTALIFQDRRLTYSELNNRVNKIANGLEQLNINKGDKLSFMLNNGIEIIELFIACAKKGIIAVPINTRFTSREVEYILRDSDSKGFILDKESFDKLWIEQMSVSSLKEWIVVDGDKASNLFKNYEEYFSKQSNSEPESTIYESDILYIGYTSGTTGLPKGAVNSHRVKMLNIHSMIIEYGLHVDDVLLMVMPMFHTNGLIFNSLGLFLGNTISILEAFIPENVLKSIHENGVTYISMVPTMYNLILSLPNEVKEKYNMNSLRTLLSSSAPLLTTTKERILNFFNRAELHEFYGSSEAGIVTNLRPKDQSRKIRSVGKPIFGVQVKLLDSEGNPVSPGEVGELFSYGPVAEGYYKHDEKTKESFQDGWFSAGDMAMMDDEGYYYIVDRKKDMINSGGENIYPTEIEEILLHHTAIKECAVIGVPDKLWGERVHAVIVLQSEHELTEQDIAEFFKGKLAGYKRPRSLEFVKELPRNQTGKILKRSIREKYWSGIQKV